MSLANRPGCTATVCVPRRPRELFLALSEAGGSVLGGAARTDPTVAADQLRARPEHLVAEVAAVGRDGSTARVVEVLKVARKEAMAEFTHARISHTQTHDGVHSDSTVTRAAVQHTESTHIHTKHTHTTHNMLAHNGANTADIVARNSALGLLHLCERVYRQR